MPAALDLMREIDGITKPFEDVNRLATSFDDTNRLLASFDSTNRLIASLEDAVRLANPLAGVIIEEDKTAVGTWLGSELGYSEAEALPSLLANVDDSLNSLRYEPLQEKPLLTIAEILRSLGVEDQDISVDYSTSYTPHLFSSDSLVDDFLNEQIESAKKDQVEKAVASLRQLIAEQETQPCSNLDFPKTSNLNEPAKLFTTDSLRGVGFPRPLERLPNPPKREPAAEIKATAKILAVPAEKAVVEQPKQCAELGPKHSAEIEKTTVLGVVGKKFDQDASAASINLISTSLFAGMPHWTLIPSFAYLFISYGIAIGRCLTTWRGHCPFCGAKRMPNK